MAYFWFWNLPNRMLLPLTFDQLQAFGGREVEASATTQLPASLAAYVFTYMDEQSCVHEYLCVHPQSMYGCLHVLRASPFVGCNLSQSGTCSYVVQYCLLSLGPTPLRCMCVFAYGCVCVCLLYVYVHVHVQGHVHVNVCVSV